MSLFILVKTLLCTENAQNSRAATRASTIGTLKIASAFKNGTVFVSMLGIVSVSM